MKKFLMYLTTVFLGILIGVGVGGCGMYVYRQDEVDMIRRNAYKNIEKEVEIAKKRKIVELEMEYADELIDKNNIKKQNKELNESLLEYKAKNEEQADIIMDLTYKIEDLESRIDWYEEQKADRELERKMAIEEEARRITEEMDREEEIRAKVREQRIGR